MHNCKPHAHCVHIISNKLQIYNDLINPQHHNICTKRLKNGKKKDFKFGLYRRNREGCVWAR